MAGIKIPARGRAKQFEPLDAILPAELLNLRSMLFDQRRHESIIPLLSGFGATCGSHFTLVPLVAVESFYRSVGGLSRVPFHFTAGSSMILVPPEISAA